VPTILLCAALVALGAAAAVFLRQVIRRDRVTRRGQGAHVAPPPDTLPGADTYTYQTISGRPLRIHLFQPADIATPRPAILFFFGGGWRIGDARAFIGQAKAFAKRGFVAALADYRVFSRDRTTPLDAVADAQAAFAWVKTHAGQLAVDPGRIVLAGGSSGGQLALFTTMMLPADKRPAALVLFNPVVDVARMASKVHLTDAEARVISPSELPVAGLPPMIIFHGDSDHAVPIETVRAFRARVTAASGHCELVEYPGQAHGFFNVRAGDPVIGRSPYADTLRRALAFTNHLGLGAGPSPSAGFSGSR
jgi:acetyl esterase/lipase